MNETWKDRLRSLIQADGRSLRAISQAAGGGPNFVQQMLKDDKGPTVEKFLAVMNALGAEKTTYVLTGREERARQTPEAALRSAMLAYGVDHSQLDLAVGIIDKFVPPTAVEERSEQNPSDDQFRRASRRHESTP